MRWESGDRRVEREYVQTFLNYCLIIALVSRGWGTAGGNQWKGTTSLGFRYMMWDDVRRE